MEQSFANCSVCQLLKQAKVFSTPMGKVKQGLKEGENWQIDFIRTLPGYRRQHYACVAVDTISSVIVVIPTRYGNAHVTVHCLETIELYYGTPIEIQSDNGTHFKNTKVAQWAHERYITWTWHLPHHQQRAGLVE